jgi:alpha-amylase
VAKWKREGRYEREVKELTTFFKRTGYPRAPRYYLMKWHADWVRKYGFDGFRADTVKHTEPGVWKELQKVASRRLRGLEAANPARSWATTVLHDGGGVQLQARSTAAQFDLGGGTTVDYYATASTA